MSTLTRRAFAALAVAAGLAAGVAAPASAQEKSIRIGWTAWSDAEAVTKLAQKILQDRMGYTVELVMADIGIQYQAVATGELDGMLMSWQPVTHAAYLDKVGKDVTDIGPIYTHARLGWVVPDYVPADQVRSIADLAKDDVKGELDDTIQGIDPGAGLMQASEKAIEGYGLADYQLVSASDAAMLAALDRAVRREEWIVVTGWSPHWMFSKYKLRYLDDPKGTLGGLESVNAVVRKNFYQDHPDVFDFFNRMNIPLDELQAVMFEAQNSSYEEAVANYIKSHPKRIDYWVTGKV